MPLSCPSYVGNGLRFAGTGTFTRTSLHLKRYLQILESGVIGVRKKMLQKRKMGMKNLIIVIYMLLCSLAVNAQAEGCGGTVSYDGKGAGQVVFDRMEHISKGLTCADCHEGNAFSFALFEMKQGNNKLSMRNMALGRSCGYCHDGKQAFSTSNNLSCSKCHQK